MPKASPIVDYIISSYANGTQQTPDSQIQIFSISFFNFIVCVCVSGPTIIILFGFSRTEQKTSFFGIKKWLCSAMPFGAGKIGTIKMNRMKINRNKY